MLITFSQLELILLFNFAVCILYLIIICMCLSVLLFLLQPNLEIISVDLTQNIPLLFCHFQKLYAVAQQSLYSITKYYLAAKYDLVVLITCIYAECIY